MNMLLRRWMVIDTFAIVWFLAMAIPALAGTFYPNRGHLYYDGQYTIEALLIWDDPEPPLTTHRGYEHDLALEIGFFDECTAKTNLPFGYDDCRTAGIKDKNEHNDRFHIFSFGSYFASEIRAGVPYQGSWTFKGGTKFITSFELNAQEVRRQWWCVLPFNSIWCMFGSGRATVRLTEGVGVFRFGTPITIYWQQP